MIGFLKQFWACVTVYIHFLVFSAQFQAVFWSSYCFTWIYDIAHIQPPLNFDAREKLIPKMVKSVFNNTSFTAQQLLLTAKSQLKWWSVAAEFCQNVKERKLYQHE